MNLKRIAYTFWALLVCTNLHAETVTIAGSPNPDANGEWEVTTVTGNYSSFVADLRNQIWWDDGPTAQLFAVAVAGAFGFPNPGDVGPAFLVTDAATMLPTYPEPFQGYWWFQGGGGELYDFASSIVDPYWTFAVAARVPASITIDVKPGSDPNCFNVNGHGVIPVAILGADDFDAASIDTGSVRFGGLEVRMRGNKGPLCSLDYVDSDSILDLVCHFEDSAEDWEPGDGEATVTGTLNDGTQFEGTDSICVVP